MPGHLQSSADILSREMMHVEERGELGTTKQGYSKKNMLGMSTESKPSALAYPSFHLQLADI